MTVYTLQDRKTGLYYDAKHRSYGKPVEKAKVFHRLCVVRAARNHRRERFPDGDWVILAYTLSEPRVIGDDE